MAPPTVAAVLFDFDGVLVDSEPLHLAGFRTALATRGLDVTPADYYAEFLGYNDEEALDAMSARYGWSFAATDIGELVAAKAGRMVELLSVPGVLYPDAAACVERLAREAPLAIVSGARRDEIELVLRASRLEDRFRFIVASGETARSKPSPDPYARAVQLLQGESDRDTRDAFARRCVAIEDSHWGIVSAKAAGLRCVGVTTSYPAGELQAADLVVDRLGDVTMEALARLLEREA
jgi:beta-phosphoglucomutase